LGNSKILRMRAPFGLAVFLAGLGAINASADTLYSDLPVTNPPTAGGYTSGANPNLPNVGVGLNLSSSIPFDIDQVSAFGGLVTVTNNSDNTITGGTVALDNYATYAEYGSSLYCMAGLCTGGPTGGYAAQVTVTLYAVGSTPGTVGAEIAQASTVDTIAWTPTTGVGTNGTCEDGQPAFNVGYGPQCGSINLVNFNLNAPLTSSFIYTVAINNDTAVPGDVPTDSLNFALNQYAAQDPLNLYGVGTSDPGTAYYNEACGASPTLSPATCGSLAQDTGWGSIGYGAISFTGAAATPEPATFGLIGFGLVGLGFVARRKKNRKV